VLRRGRQDWDDLRPYCIDDEEEWQELAEERVYIAGVTEGVTGRDGYWDVFVDMSSQTVEVGAAAKQVRIIQATLSAQALLLSVQVPR
jgi:hypothetical protein